MALKPRQSSRIAELKTPLGKDKLVITRFDAIEGVSELFEYRIEALSEDGNIDFDVALGANCSVKFKNYDGPPRDFSGVLVETEWLELHERYYRYRLVLRPWFWLLTRESDCRLFHNKKVRDIITEVLSEHGFAKYELRLMENYPTLEYCVQYRETDFAFVSRLMEYSGIFYFFEHHGDEHKMIMTDSMSPLKAKKGGAELNYIPLVGKDQRAEEHIYHWNPERRFNSGKVTLNDYDYMKPNANLIAEKTSTASYQNSKLEIYDYPGQYVVQPDGKKYATVRLEAEQATDKRCHAGGDAISCCPGAKIQLQKHPSKEQNREYMVVRAKHSFVGDSYVSDSTSADDEVYTGNYEFHLTSDPFRYPALTPKPVVHGPQTAKVVGDGEIDVDKEGRILVQFHWDRKKMKSRRVRIGQVWSGKGWGGIHIPRVGQEVIVEFVEGDPDRPLVIGTVYNGENKVPFPLPAEKTIAGVKSDSTEGGGGYNEFVFDDKKGEELIRMHGQKDLDTVIENDERRHVKKNVSIEVGVDRTEKIGKNLTQKIGANLTQDVGAVKKVTAGQKIELKVGASKIVIEPASIMITSPEIKIEGIMTTVKGTGILTLQGGMIKIN